ncbi:MAG: response regulator [Phycisphaerae bacterium]|nr:response regulator [Phycisphaerae bacterium]
MRQRLGTVAGIVLTLVVGNALLTWHLVRVLEEESTKRLALLRQDQERELVAEVRGRVDTVCIMIRHFQSISRTAKEAQQAAMDAVKEARFGESNYLWVQQVNPDTASTVPMLVHPMGTRDDLVRLDLSRVTHLYHEGQIVPKDDPRVEGIKPVNVAEVINHIALTRGEGIVSYYWPKVIDGKPSKEGYRKVAYVKYLPEWNWLVGAGAYADAVDRAVKERADELRSDYARLVRNVAGGMVLFSVVVVIIVAALSLRFTRSQIRILKAEVDERARAQEALRRISVLQEAILDNAGYGIIATDPEGVVTTFNPAAARMLGYRPGEVIGTVNVVAFHDAGEIDAGAAELAAELGIPKPDGFAVFSARPLRGLSEEREWTYVRKDGSRLPVLLSFTALRDAGGNIHGFLGISVDISERIRTEEQLRQALKMESVGRLAGGVAHDFNNMLSVILGYVEQAIDQMGPSSPIRADLEEVQKAAMRSADLTRRLLAFARRQTVAPRVLDMNETVDGMLKILRRLIGENIDLTWIPGPGLHRVWIDPIQVDQILANLCVNARDAIGGVGKVTIETHNVTLDEADCDRDPGARPGEYVVLALSDDGCGMSKETMEHLFEPFYTTKGSGEGTGLGLATVYGVARQNNGFITVYSEPDQGTTFRIYLPKHDSETEPPSAEHLEETTQHGQETVLLVEDETAILTLTKRLLSGLGYNVLTATSPSEAIRMVEEHTGEIDLLMTDVIMPGMNGRELAARLSSVRPRMRCLYMSGYTAEAIAHHGVLRDGVHFIQKPFTRRELALKVRQSLALS